MNVLRKKNNSFFSVYGGIMDINVKIGDYVLNCRAVGIIRNGNKILFQKKENDKYWALPGGKIAVGDTGEVTIKRELQEEIGIDVGVIRVHSIVENFFSFDNDKYHQYIFCYLLSVNKDSFIYEDEEFEGIENKGIIYRWIDINALEMVKPDYLRKLLVMKDDENIKFISNNEI